MMVSIEVKGNIYGATTSPITVGGVTFSWSDSFTLVAESPTNTPAIVESIFPQLQPTLLYQLMAPIQLYLSTPGRADIILRDPRLFHGPEPISTTWSDIPSIRDVIVERELATGRGTRKQVLRADPPLIYALEHFIRAILLPDNCIPELYKALESIKNVLGGWGALSEIGVTKDYVDYVKIRANLGTTDERHAPTDPGAVLSVSTQEKRECMSRVRTIIERYADSL
jgi:hypothetical protein